MTATGLIGKFFGAIINRIVRWLALSKIHPNVLTFIGLLINIWAAVLFAQGKFFAAGLVVLGAADLHRQLVVKLVVQSVDFVL